MNKRCNRFFLSVGLLCAVALPQLPAAAEEPTPVAQSTPAAAATPEAPPPLLDRDEAQKQLAEGRELARKGFMESAIVSYRRAIELDPDLVPAYEELGRILLDTRNQAYAITIYSKLERLQPENAKWKEILIDLYGAYDMPLEGTRVAEDLLTMRGGDVALMRRLATLYKNNGLALEQAQMLRRIALSTQSADDYFQAGRALLQAAAQDDSDTRDHAVQMLQAARAKDASKLEYSTELVDALMAYNRTYDAEQQLRQLIQENPQAQGLKDKLAEVQLAIGDRLLQRERFGGAIEKYKEAKETLGSSSGPAATPAPSSGNTTTDLPSAPVVPVGNTVGPSVSVSLGSPLGYRLPPPSPGGLGQTLTDRVAKAERLNGVQLNVVPLFTRQNPSDILWIQSNLTVPVGTSDLQVQLINDYRNVSSFQLPGSPSANINSVGAGLSYKVDEWWDVYGAAGTFGLYRVGANYRDERLRFGGRVSGDLVFQTAPGLQQRLFGDSIDAYADYQISDWISLGGNLMRTSYTDGINEFLYNIGPSVLPVNNPGDFVWALSYAHGGLFNGRDANPNLRFGPTNFQTDSIGTEINKWVNEDFKFNLGYFYTFTNAGLSGSTIQGGLDAQLDEGSFIRLQADYGNFVAGRLTRGFVTSNSNYSIFGQLRVTF